MSDSSPGNPLVPAVDSPVSPKQVDLGQFANAHHWDLRVTQEHSEERASRLRREERAQIRDTVTGYIKLAALLIALFGIAAVAVYMLVASTTASADDRKWAASVLTGLVTGALGYVAGERAGQAKKD